MALKEKQIAKIVEMTLKGYSSKEIAEELNVTSTTVNRYKRLKFKQSKTNPCKICGMDKGVNRFYCDECWTQIRKRGYVRLTEEEIIEEFLTAYNKLMEVML